MTLATMADRTLPLAERVLEAINYALKPGYSVEKMDALLADIAAADRLARATDAFEDQARVWVEPGWAIAVQNAAKGFTDALAAYRARMAQEVDRGA